MLTDNEKTLVLYGEGGCGKTSLLAKAASLTNTVWFADVKPLVVIRFLGTTPDSSALTPTLISICQQVGRHHHENQIPNVSESESYKKYRYLKLQTDSFWVKSESTRKFLELIYWKILETTTSHLDHFEVKPCDRFRFETIIHCVMSSPPGSSSSLRYHSSRS